MAKPIRNIVGQAVSGEDFFPRPREIRRIITALGNDAHLLLAAPRRVGKTSILQHLIDDQPNNWVFLYTITESANNIEDFFEKLLETLLADDIVTWGRRASNSISSLFEAVKKIKKLGVSATGANVELSESVSNKSKEFITLLCQIAEKLGDSKLIVMIDEFPQTVANISEKHGSGAAVTFLQLNREIRQHRILRGKVQFIYTGSIGLEGVVGRLNVSKTINDLQSIQVEPLHRDEAVNMIQSVIANPQYALNENLFSQDVIDAILLKIQWFIPFYIQIFLHQLQDQIENSKEITELLIDNTFDSMLNQNHHFESWRQRLSIAFKDKELKYALEVLKRLTKENEITRSVLYNLSIKHKVADFSIVLSTLEHDGYITRDSSDNYRFNSPILQAWWRKNV